MPEVYSVTRDTYETQISNGRHKLISDEPVSVGGQDLGFSPRELLYASLASCSGITMRMYADRKEWKLDQINVKVTTYQDIGGSEYLKKKIEVSGDLDEKQLMRLKVIADKCPVHKLLVNCIEIRSEIVN